MERKPFLIRLCSLTLLLCILVGLLPTGAFAAIADATQPTTDVEQIVIDYNSTVDIPIADIKKNIRAKSGVTVGNLLGVTVDGENNKLTNDAPADMGCKTSGSSLSVGNGIVARTDSALSYTPIGFLSQIDSFYAVFGLTGASYSHIMVEVQIIPASTMYYEAEDLQADLALDTYDTVSGKDNAVSWETVPTESTATDAHQTYEHVSDRIDSLKTTERKSISNAAFFADFDGSAANRYTYNPIYSETRPADNTIVNFDSIDYWSGSGTDSINTTAGLLSMPLTSGSTSHNIRNISGKRTVLRPGKDDYFQIRFRISNCQKNGSTTPALKLEFSTDANSGFDGIQSYNLDEAATKKLFAGEFVTANLSLSSFALYTGATIIDYFQINFDNIKAGSDSTLYVDYVYIGAGTDTVMLRHEATNPTRNYIYFGFDAWNHTSAFYNTSDKDGSVDFSDTTQWHSDNASSGVEGYGGLTFNTAYPGTVTFKDNQKANTDIYYNFLQPGNGHAAAPLNYKCTDTDYFTIRFKCTGGSTNGSPVFWLEYRTSTTTSYKTCTNKPAYTVNSDSWQTLTFDINLSSGTVITNIRPDFRNSKNSTFIIDYFAIYPGSRKDDTDDGYLFMDFTNNVAAMNRSMKGSYGCQDFNGPNSGNMTPRNTTTMSLSSSALVLTPQANTNANNYIRFNNLAFPKAANHYFQIRFKFTAISGKSISSFGTTQMGLEFRPTGGSRTWIDRINLDISKDKDKWITWTAPITLSTYTASGTMNELTPSLIGMNNATLIIDYVYIGPVYGSHCTDSILPATENLYFDFDNSNSTRYTTTNYAYNDTYTGKNHDTGYWATNTATTTLSYDDDGTGVASATVSANADSSTNICTTGTSGTYGISSNYRSLKYHPQNADFFQIRFRLNGCTVPNGKVPDVAFLYGGYNQTGSYTSDDTGEDRHTKPIAYTDQFQTITIPLSSAVRNLTVLTNLGVSFRNIQGGKVDIDYIYVGKGTPAKDPVYGYDSSYSTDDDSGLSNGRSLFIKGNGSRTDPKESELSKYTYPKKYTEATFSFNGTGFDLISRTGADQGTIRVGVYTKANFTQESCVKSITMNLSGDLELYQIPVVSIQGLTYGTYYVKIGVNVGMNLPQLGIYMGNDFYLDAIRIYDPIDVKKNILTLQEHAALYAYRADNEAYAYTKEIRDTLLSAKEFSSLTFGNSTGGALFVDSVEVYVPPKEELDPDTTQPTTEGSEQIGDHKAATVKDYNKLGPKNEVYLSPGEAVVFKLVFDSVQKPVSIDVGAKTILGDSATLAAGIVTTVDTSTSGLAAISKIANPLSTGTAMYYAIDISKLDTSKANYLVLYNANAGEDKTQNILSLTDLKICYATQPTSALPEDGGGSEIHPTKTQAANAKPATRDGELLTDPYRFEADSYAPEAAAVFINSLYETPPAEDPGEEYPQIDETVKIYHSLNLAGDISINYRIPVAGLKDYDSLCLEVRESDYEGNYFKGYTTVALEPMLQGEYYCFTLTGLTAVRMMDEIEAILYMTKDGKTYRSATDSYSIATYAYAQLDKTTISDSLKSLCANLLVYGAKAQLFKGYRTDALADIDMTEEHRSYCTVLDTVAFGSSNNEQLTDCEAPTVSWVGKTLNLGTKVGLNFVVSTAAYEGSVEDLSLQISYTDSDGEAKTAVITEKAPYGAAADAYVFAFEELLAAELRSVLTVAVYEGETQISNSLIYSADTYGNGKTGQLLTLCQALFAYSDSAAAFFTAN